MNSDLQSQVVKFVADLTGLDQSKISLETTLLGDLGIDGDDAYDFFISFSKTFKADFSGFDFTKYFGNEGITPLQVIPFFYHLVVGLRGKDPHVIAGKLPITVRELVRSAEEKRWVANCDLGSPHSPA